MKKALQLILLLLFTVFSSCEKDDTGPNTSGTGSGTNSTGGSTSGTSSSTYAGVWNRIIGASGDRTDLAIGGISGEPSNRVYMCELKGSTVAGLYKGSLSGNIISWDATHNLPKTYLRMVGSELEFDFKCCGALPTKYKKGSWSGECVSITGGSGGNGGTGGSTTGSLMIYTMKDHGCGPIDIYVDGSYKGQLTSYYNATPSCGASGTVTINLSAGSHSVYAECEDYSWPSSSYTVTADGCKKINLQ